MQLAVSDLVALKLRLCGPCQDVVVTTDVGHKVHRLAAPGVAIAGFAVPLLLRKARQHFLYVQPLIRVQAFFLGQLAGVIQVTAANVVGCQRKPGAIRLFDIVVQFALDQSQILGAAHDALLCVQPVGHAHRLRGVLGQHHQAANAGFGRDGGLPQGLLIAHGCQQAPVDLLLFGRILEEFFVFGQALLQVLGEGVSADVTQNIDVPVVAVLQALQGAVFFDLVQIRIDLVEQAVVFTGHHRPALAAGVAQIKGHANVGEVHLVHCHFVGVDQCQVYLPFIDHAQQVDNLDGVGLFVFDSGILLLEFGQLLGVGAAFKHHDAFTHQIGGSGGA